jgi:hypothetical protein
MQDIGSTLASAVIFLFAASGQTSVPLGTAFVVGYPVPEKQNQFIPLIVTAKHVVGDHTKVYGRFTPKDGTAPVTVEYDLNVLRKSGDLWEHKDPGVDIIVFRTHHFEQAKYNVVPLDLVASREIFASQQIQSTDRVIWPGLLINFMGSARNFPVVRNGSIALIPDEPVPMGYTVGSRTVETKQEVILVDGTAVPGASGSPVFLWPGPRLQGGTFSVGGTQPYVLGVLHGFYPALPREILEINVARTARMFAENSGVAIVFPAWRLREILESPELRTRIQELVK